MVLKSERSGKMAAAIELKKKVCVEVGNSKYDIEKITKSVNADFAKKNKGVTLKNIDIYVKPEDGKAYYVANGGKITGDIAI